MALKARCVPLQPFPLFCIRLVLGALSAQNRTLIIGRIAQPDMDIRDTACCKQITYPLLQFHPAFLLFLKTDDG
ncbi:hypothetical protein D3C81_2042590 [compost metagenome]